MFYYEIKVLETVLKTSYKNLPKFENRVFTRRFFQFGNRYLQKKSSTQRQVSLIVIITINLTNLHLSIHLAHTIYCKFDKILLFYVYGQLKISIKKIFMCILKYFFLILKHISLSKLNCTLTFLIRVIYQTEI